MQTLTVTEYQPITIGKQFQPGPEHPMITRVQAEKLEATIERLGIRAFRWRRRQVVPQQYVGVIPLGQIRIEILPKIDSGSVSMDAQGTSRTRLLELLALIRRLPVRWCGQTFLRTRNADLLEIYIRLFAERLVQELRCGVIRRYKNRVGNLNLLKGKLLVGHNSRVNAAHDERFFCRYEEFTEDNPYNRILKAAVRILIRVCRSTQSMQLLKIGLITLDDVEDVRSRAEDVDRLAIDRTVQRYRLLLVMARVFLAGRTHDLTAGGAEQLSLIFDMNKLFEEVVFVSLRRGLARETGDYQVRAQGPARNLLMCEKKRLQYLKPDITVWKERSITCVLDTKWKRLDPGKKNLGVSPTDVYQMFAYAKQYACPDVVLVYPWHSELGSIHRTYRIAPPADISPSHQQQPRIHVVTIDLSDPGTLPQKTREVLQTALSK